MRYSPSTVIHHFIHFCNRQTTRDFVTSADSFLARYTLIEAVSTSSLNLRPNLIRIFLWASILLSSSHELVFHSSNLIRLFLRYELHELHTFTKTEPTNLTSHHHNLLLEHHKTECVFQRIVSSPKIHWSYKSFLTVHIVIQITHCSRAIQGVGSNQVTNVTWLHFC